MSRRNLSVCFLIVIMGFSGLFITSDVQAIDDDSDKAAKRQMLATYEALKAEGEKTRAVKHLLNYSEKAYGESSPLTVKLMHRYGKLLLDDGDLRKATSTLKEALKRSIAANGPFGGSAFQLNMDIGYTYSTWSPSLSKRMRYFNKALEILRKNGKHETETYVIALVNILSNMMDNNGLKGDYSSSFSANSDPMEDDGSLVTMDREYTSYYYMAEKYILEAVEIAKTLDTLDPYMSSKIAIAHAKFKVMENADLASVPLGVDGYISGGTEKDNYNREDTRLLKAIERLSEDAAKNQRFLTLANNVRMDIMWMSKDKERMANMCTQGALNVASQYEPDRLYDIGEGGNVIASGLNMRVSTNIFRPLRTSGNVKKNRNGLGIRKPHFIPVCINGRLMAALVNAPRVTVEEVE